LKEVSRVLPRFPALLILSVAAGVVLPGGVKIGDSVQYKFQAPGFNGPGVKSMQDLRGTPVLIEFWGHN
jgi:hypothetical protein